MIYLTRKMDFSAGHRLWVEGLSAEENRRIYGECSRLHGHNYTLEATFAGEPDPRTGMVVNFSELDGIIRDRVLSRLDHRNIDQDVEDFKGTASTVEMLTRYVWKHLEGAVPNARLHRIRIWEDPESFADYYGEER
jgi:6-pyruvoyltetrahydropterin/6-carboxytetrahydropterin synthase